MESNLEGDSDMFYAIADGKMRTIIYGWPAARKYVEGVPYAFFKGFASLASANEWMKFQRGRHFEDHVNAAVVRSFNNDWLEEKSV